MCLAIPGKLISASGPDESGLLWTGRVDFSGVVKTEGTPGYMTMRSVIGASRIVDMLSGGQLPRIC